jgi:hypothetical protein
VPGCPPSSASRILLRREAPPRDALLRPLVKTLPLTAPPPGAFPRTPVVSWAKVAVGLGAAGIVAAWLAQPVIGGDTGTLMAGTEQLGRCLAELDLLDCEQSTQIGPYPVLQYVPDLVADAGVELSGGARLRVFSLLSGLGVAAAIASAWVVLGRLGLPEWRWGFLLVAASGPVLAYGGATWGEMLAAGLLTLLVAAALLPAHPALVGLAAFGASLTKETGYPFVVALGLVGLLLARGRTGAPIRRHVILGGAGVALALALSAAFNLLRFGTPRNAYYLDPALRTATPQRSWSSRRGSSSRRTAASSSSGRSRRSSSRSSWRSRPRRRCAVRPRGARRGRRSR